MQSRPIKYSEMLSDADIERKRKRQETLQNKVDNLYSKGYWLKKYVASALKRTRQTIHTWEEILIALVPEYGEEWEEGKPLNDYQRWCLSKISNYQSKAKPYKSLDDLVSYIQRNDFSLNKYIESRGNL